MKKLAFFAILSCFSVLCAQENAISYILPKVNNQKILKSTSNTWLSGDLAEISKGYSSLRYDYNTLVESDGSILYKYIKVNDDLFGSTPETAIFLSFSGNTVTMKGSSKYVVENDFLFDYVSGETYSTQNQTYYLVPAESYQTMEWSYNDPFTFKQVNAKSFYKTFTVHGKDERLLLVEHSSDGNVRKEYFMKNYGLVAVQENASKSFYVDPFKGFVLYSRSYIDNLSESDARKEGWIIIKNLRKMYADSNIHKSYITRQNVAKSIDSLTGLYEHLMIKYPHMEHPYRYILSLAFYNRASENFYEANDEKNTSGYTESIMEALQSYYFIRPSPDYISRYDLSKYVTGVDENYYLSYFESYFWFFKTINGNDDYTDDYIVYLYKDKVALVDKNDGNIKGISKFTIHSYIANYYKYKKEPDKTYYHLVITLENYKGLSEADKDLNIEYMQYLMKTMSELKPSNETDLMRAINAAINLNDYPNAVKIADNGYANGVGNSLDFAMLFAKTAYNNNVNKTYLRKAVQQLQSKIPEMNTSQIRDYLVYCQALSPEFDCTAAQEQVKKAEKKEADEKKAAVVKQRRASRGRPFHLSVSTNPFNLMWNTLPLVADLSIKRVMFEFRYNQFNNRSSKNLWGNAFVDESVKKKFEEINGADYSGAVLLHVPDRNGASTQFGLHVLYGSYTTKPERAYVTQMSNNTRYYVDISPKVSKQEYMLHIGQRFDGDRKFPMFFTIFYDFGLGHRNILYNAAAVHNVKEEDLANKEKYVFDQDKDNAGYDQERWNKNYFVFRMGFRLGLRLF